MAVSVLFILLAYISTKTVAEDLRELWNFVLVSLKEKWRGGVGAHVVCGR